MSYSPDHLPSRFPGRQKPRRGRAHRRNPPLRLLETIRQFAAERLTEASDDEAAAAAAARPDPGRVHHQPPAPHHPGQVPVGCPLAPGRQAGNGARLRRCGARRCPVKQVACRGDLCWPTLPGSGPGIAIIQRFGCPACPSFRRDSRVLPGSAPGPARCLPSRHLHAAWRPRRLPRAGSPGGADRRSVAAEGGMPHPRRTRSDPHC
jgi:hypothetical protein